jgi:hypothetical protein
MKEAIKIYTIEFGDLQASYLNTQVKASFIHATDHEYHGSWMESMKFSMHTFLGKIYQCWLAIILSIWDCTFWQLICPTGLASKFSLHSFDLLCVSTADPFQHVRTIDYSSTTHFHKRSVLMNRCVMTSAVVSPDTNCGSLFYCGMHQTMHGKLIHKWIMQLFL